MALPRRHEAMIKEEKGAALVEFAMVVPLLLLLVFGIIEFGVMIFDTTMLTNASREGARAGIVYVPDSTVPVSAIQQVVSNYCASNLVTFGPVSALNVQTAYTTVNSMDLLTVTAVYHYDFLVMPGFISALFGGVDLSAVTTMRME
jgi:Flp pilus assembly protein TadG